MRRSLATLSVLVKRDLQEALGPTGLLLGLLVLGEIVLAQAGSLHEPGVAQLLTEILAVLLAPALAQDPSTAKEADDKNVADQKQPPPASLSIYQAVARVGAALGAAACVIGGGLAIARIGRTCIEAMARQPEAAGRLAPQCCQALLDLLQ